jgi:TRAP-type C4-dicarboxylate transport system substrate-binding protein
MNSSSTRRRAALGVGVVLASVGAGSVATASVPPPEEPVVLQLATIDAVNGNGQAYGPEAFVENLDAISGGQLQVEVLTEYGAGDAEAESQIVEAIAAGEVDGGWPTVRAFANAGIPGLQAVEAPMTITSYDAEKALVSGPVADTVLSRLEGTGVIGLDLAVGPLRRPFAAVAPLLGPEDWQGQRFRAYNSPVQSDTITALGGEPVNIGFGGWLDEVLAGNLRGAEIDIPQYYENGLTTEAGMATSNVVLWPKVYVLSLSQATFDGLTEEQQGWVREAAEQASQTSVEATYDETTLARELCETGTRFIPASPEQLDALHDAVAPVIDGLAADPDNGPLLADIQALVAEYPDTDIPDVPEDCQQPATVNEPVSSSAPAETATVDSGAATDSFPEGVYLSEPSPGDVWTMTLADGIWRGFSPDGTNDCVATYTVEDDRIRWTTSSDVSLACGNTPGELWLDAMWTFEGDQLHLTDIHSDPNAVRDFGIPWTRVAVDSDDEIAPGAFPEGTYRFVNGGTVVTWVIMDGVWSGYVDGGRFDCANNYTVESGRVMLTTFPEEGAGCGNPPNFMFLDAAWTVDGDQLRLSDIHSDPNAVRDFGIPATRIAIGENPSADSGASTVPNATESES